MVAAIIDSVDSIQKMRSQAAALTLPGVERVAIRHDAANTASAAVAAKAGFVEVERVNREPQTPDETGTDVIRQRRA